MPTSPVIRNTQRQPVSSENSAASPPAASGASARPAVPEAASRANTRPLASIGYVSARSGAATGSWYERPRPLPSRARNSWKAFCTAPVSATIADQTTIEIAATRVRA